MTAKQSGVIRITGSVGGLTFYRQDGKYYVKTDTSIDKERIENDASFQRTRENMSEFGGSATVGKALRSGLGGLAKLFGDSRVSARLTGLFRKVSENGTGVRGERSFEIVNNALEIKGFNLNKSETFEGVVQAPYSVSADANRNITTFDIPDFNTDNLLNAPNGATHFQFIGSAVVLSDYAYNSTTKDYEPVNPAENEVNAIESSSEIPLGGDVGTDTQIVCDTGLTTALPATAGLVAALGIVFLQEVNGNFYILAQNNAMVIAEVF